MINYNIDENNYINYEIFGEYIIVKFLFYYDINTLENSLIAYYEYLSQKYPECNYLTSYPGALDPYVVEYHLSAMDKLRLKYKVHKNGVDVLNINKFRNTELSSLIKKAKPYLERNTKQLTCINKVSEFCKSDGMEMCSITTTLRETNLEVVSPIKYYIVDANGFLISEHDSKPANVNSYHSIRLSDKFSDNIIKLVDGSPRFHPKNKKDNQ
jgi:hypothetical protein